MQGLTNFKVSITHDGRNYEIFGNLIHRNETDGSGKPTYYARCFEIGKRGQVLRGGVANLGSDWTIKSLIF